MSDEEDDYRPSFGGGGGLGFRRAAPADESDDEQRPSMGGGLGFRPPVAFQSGTPQDENDGAPPAKKMKFSKSMGGGMAQSGQSPASGSKSGGATGFAARMMAKMGYKEGQGLGADGKGRLAPIDAQLRPQGAGLGAVREKTKQAKEEEKRAAAFRGEVLEDSSEEERKRKKEAKKKRQQQALSGIGSSQRKPRTKYRTAAEIEIESEGLEIPNVLKSLIDVTGKDTQYASTAPGIMVPQETEASKIAKRARRDLEAFADEWDTLKEQKTYAELENEQIVTDMDKQTEDMQHVQDIVQAVEDLQGLSLQGGAMEVTPEQWEAVTNKLEALETSFKDDVSKFGIHEVAVSSIQPLFKTSMLNWEPLKQPELLVSYLARLQFMLGAQAGQSKTDAVTLRSNGYISLRPSKKSTTHYETMIYTLWLPQIRSAITNEWNVEDPDSLEKLLTAWRPLLPEFVLNHVVVQLLIPRLISALTAWKPSRTGTKSKSRTSSPPHLWLFPWLHILPPSQLDSTAPDGLATELRRKVRSLLSTHDIATGVPTWLTPLRSPILPDPVFSKLTTNYLLPKLSTYLETNFTVDPLDQRMDPLDHVLVFQSLFKPEVFAELLVAGFFPKFHSVLHTWLTADPNYDEIREWFGWWQEQIPDTLRELPRMARQWNAALEMVNVAMDLGDRAQRDLPQANSFLREEDRAIKEERRDRHKERKNKKERHEKTPEKPKIDRELTFRDVIEEYCSDIGLLFMPMREAHPTNGAPLLRITANSTGKGGVVCYIHGDLLYKRSKKLDTDTGSERTSWKPINWQQELMSMASG